MHDKVQLNEGNTMIYVVDIVGLYHSIHFWALEVKEMPKSWKVVRVYSYVGSGLVKESHYRSFVLSSYKKSDRRVYLEFSKALEDAIVRLKAMIEKDEEDLKEKKEMLALWLR